MLRFKAVSYMYLFFVSVVIVVLAFWKPRWICLFVRLFVCFGGRTQRYCFILVMETLAMFIRAAYFTAKKITAGSWLKSESYFLQCTHFFFCAASFTVYYTETGHLGQGFICVLIPTLAMSVGCKDIKSTGFCFLLHSLEAFITSAFCSLYIMCCDI
jgi:hypothetical protein